MARKLAAALFCLFLLGSLSACGKREPKNANKTISYTLDADLETLDPQIATGGAAATAVQALFEGLVRLDGRGSPYPGVAESWTKNADATVFTFTLRSGAKWTDKTPVTAADFIFAFRRALDPATASPACAPMFCIRNAAKVHSGALPPEQLGVSAKDGHTLVVELEYSYPNFPALTAAAVFMPCNEAFFKKSAGRYGLERASLLSNGPFEIDGKYGWERGKHLNLVRSDTYAGKEKPLPAALKFTIPGKDDPAPDPAAALAAGTTDAAEIPVAEAGAVRSAGGTLTSFEDTTWGLCFNTRTGITKNRNVRKAFLSSFSRADVLSHLPENAVPAERIVPPATTYLGKKYAALAGGPLNYPKQSKNAAALLSAGLNELSAGPEALNLTVLCPDDPSVKLMLNDMIAAWNAGFKSYFNMEPVDSDTLKQRVLSGDYEIAVCPVQPDGDGPLSALSLFAGGAANNPAGLDDPAYNALIRQAQERSGEQAVPVFEAAENYLAEQGVFYPLYHRNRYFAAAKGVTGAAFHPYGAGVDFIRAGKE